MKKFSQIKVKTPNIENIKAKLLPLIEKLKNGKDFDECDKAFKKFNKAFDDLNTDSSIIYVRYTINTQDKKYKKLQETMDEISPYISQICNEFNIAMVNSKFRSDFEKNMVIICLK